VGEVERGVEDVEDVEYFGGEQPERRHVSVDTPAHTAIGLDISYQAPSARLTATIWPR